MRHSLDFDNSVKCEMSSNIEQINVINSKEIIAIVCLLLIISKQIVATDDCQLETIYWGPDSIPITWPKASASNEYVASDCLYDKKMLFQRLCLVTGWDPPPAVTESMCEYYQPSYEKFGKCPPNYIEFGTTGLCYHLSGTSQQNLCLKTSGSSLSFFDLSTSEQYSLLNHLSLTNTDIELFSVGMPAKNQFPSKSISNEIDYSIEDVEVQWFLPGRYGSVMKFSNNSASVICVGYRNLCVEMCLSINGSKSTVENPIAPAVEDCSNINNVLCVTRTNSLMNSYGCSRSGYFHVTYPVTDRLCYTINMLDEPLSVEAVGDASILPQACDGNNIFHIDSIESHIIYSQLAEVKRLQPHDRCLFGVAPSNDIVTYVDWMYFEDEISLITFTNWDKKMNFTDVLQRGNSLLTVKRDGKWSWEENATCIVCVMDNEADISSVKLVLTFNLNSTNLILRVSGQKYLWKDSTSPNGFLCFARNKVYHPVLQVHNEANGYYTLEMAGAGYYWCSGHVIQSFDFITSGEVYAFGMIFAVYVERHCNDICIEQNDHSQKFREVLEALIDEDLMKIEDLQYIEHRMDYTDSQIKLTLQMSVSVKETLLLENEPDNIGLSENQLNSYYVYQELQKCAAANENPEFDILSITSRDFCLPDSITSPETINWKAVAAGETIMFTDHCLILTRTCSRIGSNGAIWDDFIITFSTDDQCQSNSSNATNTLVELHNNFRSANQTTEVISNLTTTIQNVTLISDDVFVVSQIFKQISNYLLTDQIYLPYSDKIFVIFNSLMTISEDVAQASTTLNSTNSLLASFDEILIHQIKTFVIDREIFLNGSVAIQSPLIRNFVFDPVVSDVSGIALLENGTTKNEDLVNYSLRYLQPNQSIDSLLNEVNLVVASFVPKKLLDTWNKPKIIVTIFFKDILFQSSGEDKLFRADGKIISLTILNADSIFSSPIPLYFRPDIRISNYSNYESTCGYWNFTSTNGWDSNGCVLTQVALNLSIPIVLCECLHLTHFGNLISDIPINDIDEKALNLITLVGCSLSLLGIIGIFITAVVFRSWRSKSSSKFLLQLSAAIALQMVLLIFMYSDEDMLTTIAGNTYGCIAIGALIHYSVLVIFFWMLIVAYLQFIRYVIVFNQLATANFLIKSSIFGWCMPLLPVFLVIAIDAKSYIPSLPAKLCYPSGYALLFGILIPIGLIVIANIIVFASVIISLIKGSSKSAACKVNADKNEAIWSQLRLSVFLFFLLGISWIFGFLSINGSILFSYLFCVSATIQGFVLFLYFVVLDPIARDLWKKLFERMCRQKMY